MLAALAGGLFVLTRGDSGASGSSGDPTPTPSTSVTPTPTPAPVPPLPLGGTTILPDYFVVAYYGTATTESLGVLGEDTPDGIMPRLREAAAPYAASGRPVQTAYELIATIADGVPGDGDYNHDLSREDVQKYIDAAHRNKTLLVLDIQPGRTDFLEVAKRWKWALRDPWVGLAIDAEWRMGPGEVPGQQIGQVSAEEVNEVTEWLSAIVENNDLPQKLFLIHQFHLTMLPDIDKIEPRPGLAMVHHVDGFGTRHLKMETYHAVERSDLFHMGFKLFYDEDSNMFKAPAILGIRPEIEYVSYQ